MRRHTAPLVLTLLSVALSACAPSPARQEPAPERVLRTPSPQSSERSVRVSPPASLAGQSVTWDELHSVMVEAAGAIALEETILDRLLAREADRQGIIVEQIDLEEEERALLDTLAQTSSDGGESVLLEELRRRRGLGPHRYRALLQRTATMRAIVSQNVDITPEALDLARAIRFGEKRRLRVITAPSLIEARTALRALERGDSFSEVALRLSTDASAARGGLIEPLSLADPSYPAALRDAAGELNVGDVSPPIALDSGFVIARLDEIIPPTNPPGAESVLLEDARAEQERILMTALARRLLAEARLTIFDPSLETAWRRRGNQ